MLEQTAHGGARPRAARRHPAREQRRLFDKQRIADFSARVIAGVADDGDSLGRRRRAISHHLVHKERRESTRGADQQRAGRCSRKRQSARAQLWEKTL